MVTYIFRQRSAEEAEYLACREAESIALRSGSPWPQVKERRLGSPTPVLNGGQKQPRRGVAPRSYLDAVPALPLRRELDASARHAGDGLAIDFQ